MLLILISSLGFASNPDPSIQTCQQFVDAKKAQAADTLAYQSHMQAQMQSNAQPSRADMEKNQALIERSKVLQSTEKHLTQNGVIDLECKKKLNEVQADNLKNTSDSVGVQFTSDDAEKHKNAMNQMDTLMDCVNQCLQTHMTDQAAMKTCTDACRP